MHAARAARAGEIQRRYGTIAAAHHLGRYRLRKECRRVGLAGRLEAVIYSVHSVKALRYITARPQSSGGGGGRRTSNVGRSWCNLIQGGGVSGDRPRGT